MFNDQILILKPNEMRFQLVLTISWNSGKLIVENCDEFQNSFQLIRKQGDNEMINYIFTCTTKQDVDTWKKRLNEMLLETQERLQSLNKS